MDFWPSLGLRGTYFLAKSCYFYPSFFLRKRYAKVIANKKVTENNSRGVYRTPLYLGHAGPTSTWTAKGAQLTPPSSDSPFQFVFDDFTQTVHTSRSYDFFVIKWPKFIINMRQRQSFCCEINDETITITLE